MDEMRQKMSTVARQKPSLLLSLEQVQVLKAEWNQRNSDPSLFGIPHELVGKISVDEAEIAQKEIGKFAVDFLVSALKPFGRNEAEIQANFAKSKKILALGYGRGHDSLSFEDAALSGLGIVYVDVSSVSCGLAHVQLDAQYQKAKELIHDCHPPYVIEGEISAVLADPISHGIELDSICWWYLCRTLGCLSEPVAQFVLRKAGSLSLSHEYDPKGENGIVIVTALQENNPDRVACISQLYSEKMILQSIAKGAKRKVVVTSRSEHGYFGQRYTGMVIQAKRRS